MTRVMDRQVEYIPHSQNLSKSLKTSLAISFMVLNSISPPCSRQNVRLSGTPMDSLWQKAKHQDQLSRTAKLQDTKR